MKYVLVLVVGLLFSGCIYQEADQTDLLKAQKFCKDKLGVKSIMITAVGDEVVYCTDGSLANLDTVSLTVKSEVKK